MFFLFLIAIFGLVFGSFINVLVYRLPKGLSLNGRSYCPKCKRKISWYDNVPLLSYVILRGRCRHCMKKISLIYPIVEFTTALIFVITFLASQGLALRGGILYMTYVYILIVVIVPVFIIDLKDQIIPDELIYFGYLTTLVYLMFVDPAYIYSHLFSGFALALFLLSLHLVTKGKGMGLGDVKFGLFAGTFFGFPLSIYFMYIAFMFGALVGLILIVTRLSRFGKSIAFGPFLVVSFWVTMIWGDEIWKIVKILLP